MAKIDELYVYCFTEGNVETVAAFKNKENEWIPLIAASKKRLKVIQPIAVVMANENKQTLKLLKFTNREVLGTIEPGAIVH